jgi:chromosome segregation ATPase
VNRLEGHSLAAFFYQVIGKMDEKLDKERQEAYAARVKYDAALHDLSSVDADLAQIQNRLARLSDCERQYQAALSEKIKSIKASAHPAAQLVAESESRIAALKVQKRELLEAINAGKTALHTVNEVLETLDNAEGWSTWDVMGGGLMADLAKYEELDDAQEQIEQLQVELRRFKTELSDVEITADLQVTVDSFLKFADFFFDGLFADWAVLDHINQAQSRVENTKGQIKRVLALLKKMREDVDVQIADEKEKQEQLAVETEL